MHGPRTRLYNTMERRQTALIRYTTTRAGTLLVTGAFANESTFGGNARYAASGEWDTYVVRRALLSEAIYVCVFTCVVVKLCMLCMHVHILSAAMPIDCDRHADARWGLIPRMAPPGG